MTQGDTACGEGGYVECGTYNVSRLATIPIEVGAGGLPGGSRGISSFGSYLQAVGGDYDSFHCNGYNGGTGSGSRFVGVCTRTST